MVCHLVGTKPFSEPMLNQNLYVSIQENAFKNVVRNFATIFLRLNMLTFIVN